MAVLGQYDVKVGNHGHATVSVLDFDGAEWLYAHGEATMGNGSGLVRWHGDELVSASTSASFYGADKSKTRLENDLTIDGGAHNISMAVDYNEKWDEMALTGSLNQMAVLGQYDVKVGNYGHATVSVLDFDGAEWLYAHGEATMGNGSGLVRWHGDELVSASTSASFYGADKSKTRLEGDLTIDGGAHNISMAVDYNEKWDEMALTGSLNQMAVLGQYDVKVGNHGHATVSVLDFDGAEWLYAHGEATMGNGSGLVRWHGDELVSASTSASFYGADKSKTRLEGDLTIDADKHGCRLQREVGRDC